MPTTEAAPKKAKVRINKDSVWDRIYYQPHPGQRTVHRSKARHRVGSMGRRFGKSVIGGHELTLEAIATHHMQSRLRDAGHRREFWIVGPEYTDAEKEFRVFYNDLARMHMPFDRPGTYNNPESGDMVVSLWGGLFLVHAKSAKYPATLVGEGLSGVVLSEAAKLKQSVWTKYIRPTLADFKGWSLWLSTPEGKNFFYEAWQRGQDPNQPAWDSWRMPSWVNNHVFPEGATPEGITAMLEFMRKGELTPDVQRTLDVDPEVIDMAMEMTEEKFNQEIAADFTEFVGRVFKDFDEEVHVRDLKYDPDLPLYLACDYGWTNPFVMLFIQVDVWDNVYVIAEYRATRKDINDIAAELADVPFISKAITLYPDPAAPGDTVILEKKLKVKANTSTGGELKWRLELIRQKLKITNTHLEWQHPERVPKIFFDRKCHGLIYEFNEYRFPDNNSETRPNKEEPMDKDDHGPEALGRFFRGYYGPPAGNPNKGRARVSKARVG
jgi:hypothetical protein